MDNWRGTQHLAAHAKRSAERNAVFLLEHLESGMRLLDAGCGPGSITIGLAEAVGQSGRVVGIDINPDAIASAAELGADTANILFAVGNLFELPLKDASLDAVFCHAVMQHLRDPAKALRELRGVMRPGGVIGVADADHDGSIMWPREPLIDECWRLLRDLRARSGGGDPRIGKRLGTLLHEAGFHEVSVSVLADVDGNPEATRRTALFWANYMRSSDLRGELKELGMATDTVLDDIADAWLRWGQSDGACWARFWCQAIGRVPE